MQKRKLKLNVLDVVIVVAILCSIAVLAFYDSISNIFGEPEILPITVNVEINGDAQTQKQKLIVGTSLTLDLGNNIKIQAVVVSFEEKENGTVLGLSFNGYKKLGRYYSESGIQIKSGEICSLDINGEIIPVKLNDVDFSSENG